ncbi:diguanylate cyclase [Vibrio sp. NH-UV-68]|uniref:sensor domain-containing diguanylate cyclase n=1 Tax=unclassified Vibrio TaxID=2614977 RepID=UPI0036F427E0
MLFTESPYGTVILNGFDIVEIDEAGASMFGYSSSAHFLKCAGTMADLVVGDTADLTSKPKRGLWTNIGVARFVDRLGKQFEALQLVKRALDEQNDYLYLALLDLSLVGAYIRQHREVDENYKRLVLSSGQGISVHQEFSPVMVNQAWVELMHAPSIDYVLKNVKLLDFIPPEHHDAVKERYLKVLNGEICRSKVVVENICFDGKKRFFSVYDNLVEWKGRPAVQAVIEDVTHQVYLEKELRKLSETDYLTGLYNRRKLSLVLELLDVWSASDPETFSIILLDVDHFKSVNDRYGHNSGDHVLVELADTLKNSLLSSQTFGRWGGEEFLIVCQGMDLHESSLLAEELREAVEQRRFHDDLSITVSMGVASSNNCKSTQELLISADKAMYRAKQNGRNRVEVEYNVPSCS